MKESDYVVLRAVTIAGKHESTGKTVHYSGNDILPAPHSLQIAQYPGDDGYYLFYLDESGEVLTDTFHDDLQKAMDQAEWEFGAAAEEWANGV